MFLTYVIIERCAGVCEQASRGGLGLGGDALLMVCAAMVLAGGIAAPAPGVAESGVPLGAWDHVTPFPACWSWILL